MFRKTVVAADWYYFTDRPYEHEVYASLRKCGWNGRAPLRFVENPPEKDRKVDGRTYRLMGYETEVSVFRWHYMRVLRGLIAVLRRHEYNIVRPTIPNYLELKESST